MEKRTYLWIALLLAMTMLAAGCGPAATELSTATPAATERPEPTNTPEPTEVVATEEPAADPTEPQASPTESEPSPTATPESVEPTATPPQEEPTETPEPTVAPAEPSAEVLLEERCAECHGLDRVERAQKSGEEWATTVDRMVGYGAELSQAERTVLLDYLVETYGP